MNFNNVFCLMMSQKGIIHLFCFSNNNFININCNNKLPVILLIMIHININLPFI